MIKGQIVGGEELVSRLTAMPERLRGQLKTTIQRLTLNLLRDVKSGKLTGQVLNVRSGRLRRSINQRVEENGTSIFGVVGTNVEYARAHEYGFKGVVSVKSHMRKTKRGGSAYVSAHNRRMNLPERSFLRSALADSKVTIREQIQLALNGAAKEVLKK